MKQDLAVEEKEGSCDATASTILSTVKQLRQPDGRRRYWPHGGTACSRCHAAPPAKGRSYCLACDAKRKRDSRRLRRQKADGGNDGD
jgi:uncharacterized paraquat-inducible protein A